ncbi:hypothetical protein [Haloactinopolyspora sp.]|uniref:hypothetical protein n=1 Tax=Haloactinopolyspora sp. TaxID=1966353 RepID=UPI00262EC397|nr:hypothetical protein [Haloactinopolyspora sp.]
MQEHPAHSRPARAGLPVNRRTLLGTAGAAALSAAAPGFASAKGQAAAPRPAISVDPSRLPLIGDAEFPIGLWWPPPPFQTTQERYQEIADAGFTFIITGNYLFADAHIQRYAMQMAEAAGIKVVADDDTMRWITHEFEVDDDGGQFTLTSAEARSKISAVLNQYGSSSFVGIDHYDEPAPDKFATLAQTVQINRELSPETLPYINLFPTTDPAYVRQFVDVVKPSLISFDRYPLLLDGDDADFFLNWKIIRDEGLRADLPTWCFIQTLAYSGHREPTAAELLWQVNMSLAYGAKGIQYFTYWTPDPARGEGFGPALITTDGQRTERYDASKNINLSWLSPVGRQLKPLVSESVTHANDAPLPAGASEFTPDDHIRSVDGGAVVLGMFRTREESNDRWLLVANRDHSQPTSVRLRTDPRSVTDVSRFDPATESYVPEPGARVTVDLEAGAAALFRLGRRA